jgi:hypothetical protein
MQDMKPADVEQYARLVELAATKLLRTVERILNEELPDAPQREDELELSASPSE